MVTLTRPRPPFHSPRQRPSAFTLIEILLSLFILTVGVLVLATIFPVAGEWTQEATEHTIAQNIARNAVVLIQIHHTMPGIYGVGAALEPLTIPLLEPGEDAYRYGSSRPISKPVAQNDALYYWSALARLHPGGPRGAVDLFILVFKKGEARQFDYRAPVVTRVQYRSGREIPPPGQPPYNPRIFPPIGDYGIGVQSGTVFRQHLDTDPHYAAASSPLIFDGRFYEDVYYAAPARGTSVSPLVYVYHTTVAF